MRQSVSFVITLTAIAFAGGATLYAAPKLGPLASARAERGVGLSRVIIQGTTDASDDDVANAVRGAGGSVVRRLRLINGQVANVPDAALSGLANNPRIERISLDRVTFDVTDRTAATVGATTVREQLGLDGSGVGVAVIDSGITPWHDDLTGSGGQRVDRFVDLLNGRESAYDDYGHGTHVAGIIAGNGTNSSGGRMGIAPAARLLVLKALDSHGTGHISDVIAALDYVVANKDAYNIRVVNLSVAAGVFESYNTDPLTLAARKAVDAGIIVVAAAGNLGKDSQGRTRYASITAPGNAPWVLTVGASSHMGTSDRKDDTMAQFSSHGPTAIDFLAKPDLVAPGVGIESLSTPDSYFYTNKSDFLLPGTVSTTYLPYLSLSGTSMATPVVTGTVALMLQANPALSPNAVKAILQYTSQRYRGYDALTQGAGFLNAAGAVELARFFAAPPGTPYPDGTKWSQQIIWANHRIGGGQLMPEANAWSAAVTWGAATTDGGEPVAWGVTCATTECTGDTAASWAASCADPLCTTMNWGRPDAPNVVWGRLCDGADCQQLWTPASVAASLVATYFDDTVVWGTSFDDTVVWGTYLDDTVVWGTGFDDTVVWGSNGEENIIWNSGCSGDECEPNPSTTPAP
jgi:serine protease AprX